MKVGAVAIEEDSDRDFGAFVSGEGSGIKEDLTRSRVLDISTGGLSERSSDIAERIVPLLSVRTPRSEFQLTFPLAVKVYPFHGLMVAENETLGIIAHGETRPEALRQFRYEFEVLYHEIAEADPEILAEDAKHLRNILLELVVAAR